MTNIENSQLEDAIRKEMGLAGKEGTNSETEATTETEETADARSDDQSTEEKEASETPEDGNKEKRRNNLNKVFAERSKLRQEVQSKDKKILELQNKLNELQEMSSDEVRESNVDLDSKIREIMQAEREAVATKEFFESNNDAKAKKKVIEALMDDHGLTVSDAWILYQAKNDPKSLTKNQTKATSSPSVPNFGNRKDKTVASMKVDDIESELRNLHKRGELSI